MAGKSRNAEGKPRGGKERREELKKIIDKTISMEERVGLAAELARGVIMRDDEGRGIVVKDTKGMVRSVYQEKPDLKAIQFMEEYATGKPKLILDVEEEGNAFACIMIPSQSGVRK